MKLVLLGTAGYHPNERRHTACLMLPEVGVVLDAGSAMFRLPEYIRTPRLDIFLSHLHLDHVLGLTYLLDVLHVKPVDQVTVYAAPDKLPAITQHLLAEAIFPVALPCRYEPLCGPTPLAGGAALTPFPLAHPGGSLGFRLDWPDRAMAYVTDTTASPDAGYLESIRGVDLLVHECNFPDSMSDMARLTGHSCTSAVAELAREAGVGRLVLTHLNPLDDSPEFLGVAAARSIFPRIEVGFDRMEIEF
jgi:ribonuclease BN (tRNA processing enzyme)